MQCAPYGARTPSGVPPRLWPEGLTHPNGSAWARLRGASTDKRRVSLRPAPAPVAASTSHAGHSVGRHDAQSRPGEAVTRRRLRAPHSLHQPLSPGWRPSRERDLSRKAMLTVMETYVNIKETSIPLVIAGMCSPHMISSAAMAPQVPQKWSFFVPSRESLRDPPKEARNE
jgi:hypothetical protein